MATTESTSRSGIRLQAHYTAGDGPPEPPPPGQFPFTRGRHGQVRGGWIQRELSGEGGPATSNAQLRFLLAHGQTGIDVIGDSPTMALLDPDHPMARHAIGTQGVSLCCKADYLTLFRELPLDTLSVSSSAPALFATIGLYLAARAAGVAPDRIRGSVIQAPLYMEDCSYAVHLPCRLRVRMAADVMEFCAREMPRFHAFLEDTYFFSEVGLTPVEEMALGFVEIRHLVRTLMARGVSVDAFAPRIAILVNCGMDFFEEIAKLRATRRIFARMMREEFGARDPRSLGVVITSHTSGLSLTAQQPVNNVVRGTLQALALVLGGAHAIEISTFDEAFRTPSPEAHLVALRTQQIIDLESGAGRVADPLGGSYYVEQLTDEMERRILALVAEIEGRGDPESQVDRGVFRDLFRESSERYARQLGDGKLVQVGVNVHRLPETDDTLLREVAERRFAPAVERVEEIAAFKRARAAEPLAAGLRAVYAAARGTVNLVPPVLEATEAGATMGEIAGMLRLAYGQPYDPHGMIPPVIDPAA